MTKIIDWGKEKDREDRDKEEKANKTMRIIAKMSNETDEVLNMIKGEIQKKKAVDKWGTAIAITLSILAIVLLGLINLALLKYIFGW